MKLTIKQLTEITKTSFKDLRALSLERDNHYRRKEIKKKDRSTRELYIPSKKLSTIQRLIHLDILQKIVLPNFVHSQKKHSHVMHAIEHQHQVITLTFDIENFYPTIKENRVKIALNKSGISLPTAKLISKLCCYKNILPQGTSTSPALASLVALNLDKRLAKLCLETNAVYSRYADDIAISGGKGILKLKKIIEKIFKEEGFRVNQRKTQVFKHGNLILGDTNKLVGLRIGKIITPPDEYYKITRAMIHTYEKNCKKNIDNDRLRNQIQSRLGYGLYIEKLLKIEGKFGRLKKQFRV